MKSNFSLGAVIAMLLLAGCVSAPLSPPSPSSPPSPPVSATPTPAKPPIVADARSTGSPSTEPSASPSAGQSTGQSGGPSGGAYYLNDGPHAKPPANLDRVPEPEPVVEPLHPFANRPYVVFGQRYIPDRELRGTVQRGVASWYGRRFHGNRTSNGEIYDMYQLTAAHPTLPLPSFARVTNLANGRSVIVRINDRGPFLRGRAIDLSYAAAARLGYVDNGHAEVEVQSLLPRDLPQRPPAVPAPPIAPESLEAIAAASARPGVLAHAAPPPVVTPAPISPAPIPQVAPAAATQSAAAKLPIVEESVGHFVQLGAFRSADNAERVLAQFIFQLEEFSERLRVVAKNGLHRVLAGPYRSRGEALAAASKLGPLPP